MLHNLDTPTVCVLNGGAAGYGLDLALGCDIRVAAASAKLNPGFAKRGILPESGGTWLMPRIVGYAKAAEIAFRGRTLTADDALELGLVNHVVADADLEKFSAELAGEIAANAPLAVRAIKRMMRAAETETFEQHVHHVFLQLLPLLGTADFREGVAAFMEKRRPTSRGDERGGHRERSRSWRGWPRPAPSGATRTRRSPTRTSPRSSGTPGGRRRARTARPSASSCCVAATTSPARRASCSGGRSAASWVDKRADMGVRVGTGAAADGPKERMAASMQHYVDHLEQTPVIVLVGLDRYRPANPYEGASVYPACQNLLLAARALGYGGALTGFHHAVEDELRELLGVPDQVALSACITLGVPAGRHGPLRRKPIAELTHDGRWGRHADWLDGVDPDPSRGPNLDRVTGRAKPRAAATRSPCSASPGRRGRRSCGPPAAAWPRTSTPIGKAAMPAGCGSSTSPSTPRWRRCRPRRWRRPRRRPRRARSARPAPSGPTGTGARAGSTPTTSPRSRSRRYRPRPSRRCSSPRPGSGEVLDDEPPYRLDVDLGEPFDCWCRLELLPDAGASTVSVTLASRDGRPVPDLDAVRDTWVATLNAIGRPDG